MIISFDSIPACDRRTDTPPTPTELALWHSWAQQKNTMHDTINHQFLPKNTSFMKTVNYAATYKQYQHCETKLNYTQINHPITASQQRADGTIIQSDSTTAMYQSITQAMSTTPTSPLWSIILHSHTTSMHVTLWNHCNYEYLHSTTNVIKPPVHCYNKVRRSQYNTKT